MRKFLYIALLFAATVGFTSCEETECERPADESDGYLGALVVTNLTDTEADQYTKLDVKFDFNDETNTLTMWEVSFAEMMPVSVDIVIANIPEGVDDTYKIDSITATLESGEPAPEFIGDLKNVVITEVDDALEVAFMVDVTFYGATTTYGVGYAGIEEDKIRY